MHSAAAWKALTGRWNRWPVETPGALPEKIENVEIRIPRTREFFFFSEVLYY
jgi:hypothetical protein